jgi:hypothetical protein
MDKRHGVILCLVSFCCFLLLTGCWDKGSTTKGIGRLPEEAAAFQQEDRVAVIAGIDAYAPESNFRPLSYAVEDAQALKAAFEKRGYKVKLLTDGQAKKHFILQAIQEAGKLLEPEKGTLVFAFTGHGFAGKTAKGEDENFLAVDGTTDYDLANSGLGLRDVKAALKATGARRNMVFIDACRDNPLQGKSASNPGFAELAASEGLNILYSTAPGDVSVELPEFQHGLFTHFLLDGLEGKAAQNGLVLFDGLADYVTKQVKDYSFEKLPKTQKPYRSGESSGQFLVAALSDFKLEPETISPATPTHFSSSQSVVFPPNRWLEENENVATSLLGLFPVTLLLLYFFRESFFSFFEKKTIGGSEAFDTKEALFQPVGLKPNSVAKPPPMPTADEAIIQGALKGDVLAQVFLGNRYKNGENVKQDYAEAVKWYRKAADQGNALGQVSLGHMYKSSSGVKQDYAEAVKWYRKAADQGNALGQASLGYMYENGKGVKQDYVESAKWYRKAANQGSEYANKRLKALRKPRHASSPA